VNVTYM